MKTKQEPRGEAVNAVISELAFRTQLRKLAEQRERRMGPKKGKKKEACTAATEQTPSALLNATKPQKNYITEQEGCQDDTSGNSSNGEIRKQICQTGLPVYLL